MQHVAMSRSLVFWPGEWPGDVDGFGEEDVMPCGHILWLRRASVSVLEVGAKLHVARVLGRVLELAPESGPVPQVRF